MARTTINPQQVVRTGLTHAFVAADQVNGNQFMNTDERVFLYVKNGGAGAVNVTILTPITVDDLSVPDRVVNIAAGVNKLIGPFQKQYYNQTDGMVYVDYDTGTSVTVAVVRL